MKDEHIGLVLERQQRELQALVAGLNHMGEFDAGLLAQAALVQNEALRDKAAELGIESAPITVPP